MPLATTPEEVAEVFASLPAAVTQGLAIELDIGGDVHRYDFEGRRAYYFERQANNLAMWRWNEVHHRHEAGELIVLVVNSTGSIDEKLANASYVRATGRTIERPWAPIADDDAMD